MENVSMVSKRSEVHSTFLAYRQAVEKTLASSTSVNWFMQHFYAKIPDREEFLSRWLSSRADNFEKSILEERNFPWPENSIPKSTHRIWLTNEEDPSLPPHEYIEKMISVVRSCDRRWRHMFWSNSAYVLDEIAGRAAVSGIPVELRKQTELSHDDLYENIQTLIRDCKYALAADVLKTAVLYKHGGLYSDLGLGYDQRVLDVVELSNYAFFLGQRYFFQLCFVAAPPRSSLLSIFRGIQLNPSALAAAIDFSIADPKGQDEVRLFAGPGFSIATLLFCPALARTAVFVALDDGITYTSQASWYGHPKFGNAHIASSPPSLLGGVLQNELADDACSAVEVYGKSPLLELKTRILVQLTRYFDSNPARLCEIMFFNGSDKGLKWHNYSFFYNYLLADYVFSEASLLEIGIGTNYLDVPSSMGARGIPGASLRAWAEFLSRSKVFGADIDVRILFEEGPIKTYFVDQRDRASIGSLWKCLPEKPAIVIDDGLHQFEANVNLLEESMRSARGSIDLFFVEDVGVEYLDVWRFYLSNSGLNAVLIVIPHSRNRTDNNMIIVDLR